jgi:hypothetical protein
MYIKYEQNSYDSCRGNGSMIVAEKMGLYKKVTQA